MRELARRWVQLWDTREYADSLAIVRILVPLVMLYDLFEVCRLGLIRVLWAPIEEGGLGPASYEAPTIRAYEWFGAHVNTTYGLVALTVVAALCLMLGLFSRTSALILLLGYAQLERLSPDADRGIDTLLRNVVCILMFSRAGATFSLEAWFREKRLKSDRLVPAWPRYLIIFQMMLLYFFAGFAKSSPNWSYGTGYVALFYTLEEPHYQRFVVPRDVLLACYPLIQFGAFATLVWERSALLLPVLLWLRETRARGSWLHRWSQKLYLLPVWVGTGMFFHLSLAVFLALGIFPWGCLALYPALAKPTTWRRWVAALRARIGRGAAVTAAE